MRRLRFPSIFIVYNTISICLFGKLLLFVLLPLHSPCVALPFFVKTFSGSFYKLTSWRAGLCFAHQRTSWMPSSRVHPFAAHTVTNLPFVNILWQNHTFKQASISILSPLPFAHVLIGAALYYLYIISALWWLFHIGWICYKLNFAVLSNVKLNITCIHSILVILGIYTHATILIVEYIIVTFSC